jgi:hypothetical protein
MTERILSREAVEAIKARCSKASEGPYFIEQSLAEDPAALTVFGRDGDAVAEVYGNFAEDISARRNALFFCASRTDVEQLCETVEALVEALEWYRDAASEKPERIYTRLMQDYDYETGEPIGKPWMNPVMEFPKALYDDKGQRARTALKGWER